MTSHSIVHRALCCSLLPCLLTLLPGCGDDGPQGGPRVETHPITGLVTVDGVPAENLLVTCIPQGDTSVATNISGFTGPEGKFTVGTYESGDGAPEGDYVLTFKWGQWNMNGRYGAPDKLGGRYDDAEESQWTAVVASGLPNDMGTIELTTSE